VAAGLLPVTTMPGIPDSETVWTMAEYLADGEPTT
jgi:hypothetical protein